MSGKKSTELVNELLEIFQVSVNMCIQKTIDKNLYLLVGIENITYFLVLRGNGKRPFKRAARISATNSSYYRYAKFTKNPTGVFLGGNVSKNLGSLTGSNSYGDRVSVLARKFSGEGGQLNRPTEVLVTNIKSGFEFLKDIANGNFDPVYNVYRVVYNIEVLKASYCKLKSNSSFMIHKIDGKYSNGLYLNEQYFEKLSKKIKAESYTPLPTKRISISKVGGKARSSGISAIEDLIVQQSLLYLLEAVFEKMFSDKSHRFRANKSVHTVCKNIRQWKKINWFLKGEIANYFDTIDHQKLMKLINQKIKDPQVLDLLWKYLRAGVFVNGKVEKAKVGLPQGAVINSLLSNIYLHELDMFVNELKTQFDRKIINKKDSKHLEANLLLESKKKVERKKTYREFQTIKPVIRVSLKLHYIRYADSWLVGIRGTKKDVANIREKIEAFLKGKLTLEKTKILDVGKKKIFFLGYDIHLRIPEKSFLAKNDVEKQTLHVTTHIDVPYNKIKDWLIENNLITVIKNKWLINPTTHWVNYSHSEILHRYNWVIRSYLNYYSSVNNLHIFHKLIGYILRHSCALTLCKKFKLRSRKKVFKNFGKNLRDPKTKLTLNIPISFRSNVNNYKTIPVETNSLKIIK